MKISLIICTRNRATQLSETLKSIDRLRCSIPWELVIVNNGSIDKTRQIIERYRESCVVETYMIDEPLPGLGRARNRGWSSSHGDIIAFTDDDCYPDEYFLENIIQCFEEDHRIGFIGGRILLYDPTDYSITIIESTLRKDLPPHSFVPAGMIAGANFALRREAIEMVGGFDDIFGAGSMFPCEDVDILARISHAGWYGAYDPRPLVFHHHRRKTVKEASALMKQYDRGRGAYYTKCVINFPQHGFYLKNWYRSIRSQKLGSIFRECSAALEYLMRICIS